MSSDGRTFAQIRAYYRQMASVCSGLYITSLIIAAVWIAVPAKISPLILLLQGPFFLAAAGIHIKYLHSRRVHWNHGKRSKF